MKKKLYQYLMATCISASLLMAAGCGSKQPVEGTDVATTVETQEEAEEASEEAPVKKVVVDEILPQVTQEEVPQYEGYTLLWNDEFNGTTLNEEIWNIIPRQPYATNLELQEYTKSPDNVFVENGKLTLKALKTKDKFDKDYYTSGKVTTKKKKDFTYGKVDVRAKIPAGQGLWPAIWMMPTEETKYGQWPRCGEIDIMEILGQEPALTHGTIHYGNPHEQQQGHYELEGETFADAFHVYGLEWEPGEMRFYVDGNIYHTVNDWYSSFADAEPEPYPAPFDQNFYMQLNLAVGGNWPGDPDETTDFDNAEFEIDYVRVYQKPEYDTNVTKPAPTFREPLENGNIVYNGDFSETEDLADDVNWNFILNEGGAGSAEIKDGMIVISTDNEGKVDYSIQLVQKDLPLYNGKNYKVTFEAYADENRKMVACVTGPSANYIRYMEDTTLDLTKDWQTYEYEFEMIEKDDNNGRIEFNMGKAGSTATVYIRNVRVEEIK